MPETPFSELLTEYLERHAEQRAHLEGSRAKLERARTHLKTLQAEMRRFREKAAYNVYGDRHAASGTYFLFVRPPRKVPPKLSAIAGDILSNIRPALDYLVFALAKLDSGEVPHGTQFPITSNPKLFEREIRRGRLAGLSEEHVTAIEKSQPYDRSDNPRNDLIWLAWLRDLSNPDKHRELNVLVSGVKGDFEVLEKPRTRRVKRAGRATSKSQIPLSEVLQSIKARQEPEQKAQKPRITFTVPKEHPLYGSDVYVQLGLRFDVAFENRLPVVETLKVLHSQTAELIKAFDPEFERE
jgi:hypothetical protein